MRVWKISVKNDFFKAFIWIMSLGRIPHSPTMKLYKVICFLFFFQDHLINY